jgi:hypothetical protein
MSHPQFANPDTNFTSPSTPCDGVAGVDVGIGAAAGYAHGAALRVLKSGSASHAAPVLAYEVLPQRPYTFALA